MAPSMAETACLYLSKASTMAPSPPFSNGSPLHYGYLNGNNNMASYNTATTVNEAASKPTSNGYSNGSSSPATMPTHALSVHYPNGPTLQANGHGAAPTSNIIAVNQKMKGNHVSPLHASTNGSSTKINTVCSNGQPVQTNACALSAPVNEPPALRRPSLWYEEEIDESLRWSFGLSSILHTGVSKFQEIALLDTLPFGKVLTLDRKMQSAEMDEWVYHECLVHPALLLHKSPKSIFIMGGGEGSTAREALRHRSVEQVVMCDIDEEVVKFCSEHLTINKEAFQSKRLELCINDAKLELESRQGKFDIIIGDLADPLEWGPCYQLYSRDFYQNVVRPKLHNGGIFVTQAGPAGVLSHKEVFTSIYNTLRNVFTYVVAYSAHVPSYADTWGWVVASDQPLMSQVSVEQLECRIKQRIKGELRYLDGATIHASTVLNKTVRLSLENERHVYTEESARFIYGHGRAH